MKRVGFNWATAKRIAAATGIVATGLFLMGATPLTRKLRAAVLTSNFGMRG